MPNSVKSLSLVKKGSRAILLLLKNVCDNIYHTVALLDGSFTKSKLVIGDRIGGFYCIMGRILMRRSFSSALPSVGRSLMGRYDEGDWVGLEGLWIIFIMKNFHRAGKWVVLRTELQR